MGWRLFRTPKSLPLVIATCPTGELDDRKEGWCEQQAESRHPPAFRRRRLCRASRISARGPSVIASGTTPRINAGDIIRVQAAKTATAAGSEPCSSAWRANFDDQDGALGRQTNKHDKPDLHGRWDTVIGVSVQPDRLKRHDMSRYEAGRRRYSDPRTAPLPYDFRRYLIGVMFKVTSLKHWRSRPGLQIEM